MAQRQRFSKKRQHARLMAPRASTPREAPPVLERKPPTEYGKPFIVMEDTQKNTFEFKVGSWIPYGRTIAQCRKECQIKMLPQKVNNMTRYEVREPLPLEP